MAFIEELRVLGALLIVAGFGLCAWSLFALKQTSPDRNADRRRRVEEDGHAAAAEHGLGAFVSLRQADWSVPGDRHSEYLTVSPWLVVLATPPGAMVVARTAVWWLGLLISVVGMTAGWLSARWMRRETMRYVLRYERGLVFRSEKAVYTFRWADITEVRETLKKSSYHGHHFIDKYYNLRTIDGRKARVKGEEFGTVILSNMPAAARPRVTAAPRAAPQTASAPQTAAAHPAPPPAVSTVPPRIAEVAARLGLGEPRGSAADSIRITTMMVAFTLLGPAVILAPLRAVDTKVAGAAATPVLVISFIGLFILPIWAAASNSHAKRSRCTCYLFTGGVVLTGLLGGVRAFAAWDDVACIYWQRRDTPLGRQVPSNAYRVWILRRGQRALSIYLSNVLGPELAQLQTAAVLPGLAARLTAGQTLRFGPFRMSPAGVDDGLGAVSWDEITGLASARDRIGINQRPVRVERKHLPDVLVFEQLVRAFAGRPWAGAPTASASTGPGDAHTVRDGWRDRLLAALTPLVISRLAVALGGGIAIATAGVIWYALPPVGSKLPAALLLSIPYFPIAAGIAYGLVSTALWKVIRSVTSAAAAGRPPLRRRWLVAAGAAAVAGAVTLWQVAPDALTGAALTALPALLVFALGSWIYLLTSRRVKSSRHRWLRHLADLPVAASVGVGVLLMFHRDLLAHQPAAAVFFPLAAWCSVWIWRAMGRSPRLAVRAGADVVLSLLLGADLVLFLVWLANLLGLSEPEVAFMRGVLQRTGAVADLPWWLWLGLLVLLAGSSLAFAIWPGRLRSAIRWSDRLHLAPSVEVSRRLLTGTHIGLLVIVLVGLSVPPGLEATLRGPLRTTFTVTVQRELQGAGERAAYEAIQRQFSSSSGTTPSVNTLTAIVSQIHTVSDSTSTEEDLARRIGQIQAIALGLSSPQQVQATAAAAASGFEPPVANASDLSERLGKLDAQQRQAEKVKRLVEQAGDLAAAAVARTISIPGVGDNEIVQVVREYLTGLVEDSPLKDVFAAWATRLVTRLTPPSAATLVVPDPGQLDQAAATALADERARLGLSAAVGTDPATLTDSAVAAAVELANQARLVAEGNTSCYECTRIPGVPDQPAEHQNVPFEDPVEPPHDFVP